jgi:integrase
MIRHVIQPISHGKRSRLWSARVRLDGWLKPRTYPLHVTDKRVAEQKLEKLVQELEKESAGIIAPKLMRDAAQTPIADHLKAFLADIEAKGRSKNTLSKYRNCIPKLCKRCSWVRVRDITSQSFCQWRAASGLGPKTLNDLLGAMCSLLQWMERQQLIIANPLKHAGKITNQNPKAYRRALSVEHIEKLLAVSPLDRAMVYLTVLYTGLRRAEMNGLKWEDFDLDSTPALLRVPSSISKNKKATTHELRTELADALRAYRPASAKPSDWAFKGHVPRVHLVKRDLKAAGIPFEDEQGRRVDLHALRHTFITLLSASGVAPRVAMALARHSDLKLTMRVYTDSDRLGLDRAMALLPSIKMPKHAAQLTAQAGAVSGLSESPSVASSQAGQLLQFAVPDASRHEKAPGVITGRFHEMEREKRLELSTSTLARWCSTN